MSRVLPILFNTDMVRAILDGRKTATRRVIKPANPFRNKEGYRQGNGLWIDGCSKNDEPNGHIKDYSVSSCWMTKEYYIEKHAPYHPEDTLYVRETWAKSTDLLGEFSEYIYRADHTADDVVIKWHPSIHMPKEAARIWLKVTDVKTERLHDITNEQILKEGISQENVDHYMAQFPETTEVWVHAAHFVPFSLLWNDTIKKQDIGLYDWDSNPWVWVIEYERCAKPEEL